MKSLFRNILLILIATFLTVLGIDLSLRLFKIPLTFQNKLERVLFWHRGMFVMNGSSGVHFKKNSALREVAIYGRQVEYETVYRTNNQGFVDNIDYVWQERKNRKSDEYVFVGDSFTAGSGGYPWVAGIREQLRGEGKNPDLYNFGVPGTGIPQFEELLMSVAPDREFTHIVVTAISADFWRASWHPVERNSRLVLCYDMSSVCPKSKSGAITIDSETTYKEMLSLAEKEYALNDIAANHKMLQPVVSSGVGLYARLRKIPVLRRWAWRMGLAKVNKMPGGLLLPLIRIKNRYPKSKIHLVHLPEVQEVTDQMYGYDLDEDIKKLGIEYFPALRHCRFGREHFYPHDGHPNPIGYKVIENCVKDYLFPKSKS